MGFWDEQGSHAEDKQNTYTSKLQTLDTVCFSTMHNLQFDLDLCKLCLTFRSRIMYMVDITQVCKYSDSNLSVSKSFSVDIIRHCILYVIHAGKSLVQICVDT